MRTRDGTDDIACLVNSTTISSSQVRRAHRILRIRGVVDRVPGFLIVIARDTVTIYGNAWTERGRRQVKSRL